MVTGAASSSSFSDIRGHWAEAYINQLSAKGLVSGIGNGMFGPENKLTRSQFLAMLAKLSGEDVSKSPAVNFKDVPGNEWYYAFVNWGSAAGIVKGKASFWFLTLLTVGTHHPYTYRCLCFRGAYSSAVCRCLQSRR